MASTTETKSSARVTQTVNGRYLQKPSCSILVLIVRNLSQHQTPSRCRHLRRRLRRCGSRGSYNRDCSVRFRRNQDPSSSKHAAEHQEGGASSIVVQRHTGKRLKLTFVFSRDHTRSGERTIRTFSRIRGVSQQLRGIRWSGDGNCSYVPNPPAVTPTSRDHIIILAGQ